MASERPIRKCGRIANAADRRHFPYYPPVVAGPKSLGLIGFGAIARVVARHLAATEDAPSLRAVLLRPGRTRPSDLLDGAQLVTSVAELLAAKPGLVVECAGHEAVEAYGAAILAGGVDLLVASVGALADRGRLARMTRAAAHSGASLIVPSGAVGGLDLLAAARVAGLSRVTYVSRKPPRAWKGTAAEKLVDLESLRDAVTFYTGPADAAARDYPQNANVAAAVALAGMGFDKTDVRLIADPAAPGNVHRIEAEGAFGRTEIVIEGRPLPDNPKTSMLAALSLVRAILNRGAAVVV